MDTQPIPHQSAPALAERLLRHLFVSLLTLRYTLCGSAHWYADSRAAIRGLKHSCSGLRVRASASMELRDAACTAAAQVRAACS